MSKTKSTKSALLMSFTSLLLCFAMLIGSTFAWFTDSATTAVNKIQAGTLDVQLLDEQGTSLEGQTLKWVRATTTADEAEFVDSEDILWEPGCTYNLQPIVIKNNGNLALKYKIVISGIVGDAQLLEAIDFTVTGVEGATTAAALNGFEGKLAANATTDAITISGHMKESAGNDYQGKFIDNIAITVVATQDTAEFDSTTDQYDADATYPVAVAANVVVGDNNKVTEQVIVQSAEKVGSTDTPVAKVTVPAEAAVLAGNNQLTLTIDEVATPANIEMAAGTDTKTFEVDMKGLDKENNTALFKVEMYVGANLGTFRLYHNGTAMTEKTLLSSVQNDQDYYYNSTTGVVTFLTKTFSPFTCSYDKDSWANHAAESYATAVDTASKVVTIASAKELALFAKEVNSGTTYSGYTVNLTADIDLNQYAWSPIGKSGLPFCGTFNGNNHVISNLYIKGTQSNSAANNFHGLFGNLQSPAVVKDFTINNATVNGSLYVGAVAGMAYTGKEISGIKLTGDIKITGYWYVGGIAGNGYINEVKNCTVEASADSFVKGTGSYIGGIFGFRGEGAQKITSCVSNITVSGYSYVGGISGMLHYGNTISDCTANCTVIKTAPGDTTDLSDLYGIGGIAGISVDHATSKCLIENCTFNGELVSNSDIVNGGVIGYNRDGVAANNLTVTNCTVNGTLVNIS